MFDRFKKTRTEKKDRSKKQERIQPGSADETQRIASDCFLKIRDGKIVYQKESVGRNGQDYKGEIAGKLVSAQAVEA